MKIITITKKKLLKIVKQEWKAAAAEATFKKFHFFINGNFQLYVSLTGIISSPVGRCSSTKEYLMITSCWRFCRSLKWFAWCDDDQEYYSSWCSVVGTTDNNNWRRTRENQIESHLKLAATNRVSESLPTDCRIKKTVSAVGPAAVAAVKHLTLNCHKLKHSRSQGTPLIHFEGMANVQKNSLQLL